MARSRPFRSLRFRVTVLATVVVAVVLALGGLAVVEAQRSALRDNVDDQLEQMVDALVFQLDTGERPGIATALADDDTVFQVVDGDGMVTNWSDGDTDLRGGPIVDLDGDDDARTVTIDDDPFRVVVEHADDDRAVIVASSLEDVDESIGTLIGNLLVGVPAATVALAVVLWFVVGRTLRPVEAIRAEVAAIGGSDLHRRVPEPREDDEIGRLARTMNGMLDRIEDAAARQQRFVADASHELRSPLTRMRTELEVDLAHPDRADATATHRSVLEETIGLQDLVDDLLHLARSDAGRDASGGADPVDLTALSGRAAADLEAAGRVAVDTTGIAAGVVVTGRAADLRRLVGNLLDNAGRHARSTVTLTLTAAGGGAGGVVELVVADDGPGIPPADAERVFERFTRLDAARTAGVGGAGLGLAIARDIAEAHGGTLTVDPAPAGGARFVLRLPGHRR